MGANHELNWHIDTDPSVICRAQICIKHTKSVMEFNTKGQVHTLYMKPGDIYFINTGWSHRVVNNSDTERVVAIFGFEFSDLQPHIKKHILIN
jgi:oxalate decarboxylase/phosphoglucose isomerase-like protein (cupin superfamily)